MDFKTLANPWVLGGGALIGVIILMSRGSSGSSSVSDNAATLASIDMANQNTRTALEYNASVAETGAKVAVSRMQRDATISGLLMGTLQNMNEANAIRSVSLSEANRGTVNTLLTTNAMVKAQKDENNARIALTKISEKGLTDRTNIATKAAVSMAMLETIAPVIAKSKIGKGNGIELSMFGINADYEITKKEAVARNKSKAKVSTRSNNQTNGTKGTNSKDDALRHIFGESVYNRFHPDFSNLKAWLHK